MLSFSGGKSQAINKWHPYIKSYLGATQFFTFHSYIFLFIRRETTFVMKFDTFDERRKNLHNCRFPRI
uniref:Uncharacterized protein n=1 Tax=Meloidogyne enterolobii TaxID=390850 RepID=A0A6V7VP52_MELEN|nr:unnamed protein product [Meloidogyne enterolobii]